MDNGEMKIVKCTINDSTDTKDDKTEFIFVSLHSFLGTCAIEIEHSRWENLESLQDFVRDNVDEDDDWAIITQENTRYRITIAHWGEIDDEPQDWEDGIYIPSGIYQDGASH